MARYLTQAGLTRVWTNIKNYISNNIPSATASKIGGVKTGYTTTGKNYKVQLDSSSNAFVNVPWANTTYGVATTSANGLMPKLPTTNITTGDDTSTPTMQVLTGDGKYKAIDLGYNPIINKLSLGFHDAISGYGDVSATIPIADTTADGLMSKDDKTKLDGFHSVMETNGSYILTEAGIPGAYYWNDTDNQMEFMANDVPGNWLSEYGWEYSNNNIFVLPNIPTATTTTGGVMSPEDKKNLNNGYFKIYAPLRAEDVSTQTIRFPGSQAGNGIWFFGAKPAIKFYGINNMTPFGQPSTEKAFMQVLTIDNATSDVDGLMAKEDKSKLDGGVLTAVWDLRGKDASTSAGWSGLDVTPLINEHRPLVCIMDNGNNVETVSVSYKTGNTIYLWYHASKTVDNKTTYVLTEVHLWYSSTDKKTNLAIITNPTI